MAEPIIIIGAGWAGLSAAVELTRQGKSVIVLEAGSLPGGRARGVQFDANKNDYTQSISSCDEAPVRVSSGAYELVCEQRTEPATKSQLERRRVYWDNGQHLLLGGYDQTLSLLRFLNIKEQDVLKREPFNVFMHRRGNNRDTPPLHFKFWPILPGLLSGLGSFFSKGLSWQERIALYNFYQALRKFYLKKETQAFNIELETISLRTLLLQLKQPLTLIESLWEPLGLAALSTPPDRISAKLFLSVLQKAFLTKANYSDLLFPTVNLSQVFPLPACDYIRSQGNIIYFQERATTLLFEGARFVGVKTKQHTWRGSQVILAIPPYAAVKLLKESLNLNTPQNSVITNWVTDLSHFEYHPITTVYLVFKPGDLAKASFKSRLLGFTGGIIQWLFDLTQIKNQDMLSVVITGRGIHSDWSQTVLVQEILKELRYYYPNFPDCLHYQVITEKRATFCCNPKSVKQRDKFAASINAISKKTDVYFAGDYLQTELPATLESAVQSGISTAKLLL